MQKEGRPRATEDPLPALFFICSGMPRMTLVHADGRFEETVATQAQAARVLGDETGVALVGAIDELRAFAVARRERAHLPLNVLCVDEFRFHETPIRGPVLFVGTGDDGEEIDVDAEALRGYLLPKKGR